ncbi:MAG: creatininase family protein [Halobacteriota archaeon]
MYLGDETWPDLGDYVASESLALVPLGSTEQHGPHLPLSTDHRIAQALARKAADRAGVLCTPTVTLGVSPHHRQFHGTMWVDPPQFRDFVESFTRNLTYHGIDRVVYVNAHGGNVTHLREVGRRLRDDDTAYAVEWMWDESIPDLVTELFDQPGPHAGPKETSMMLHIDPDIVRTEQLEAARDGGLFEVPGPTTYQNGTRVTFDAVEHSPNGAFGDQTDASARAGERLFEAATEQLVALVEWLREQRFEDLLAPDHVDPQPGSRR